MTSPIATRERYCGCCGRPGAGGDDWCVPCREHLLAPRFRAPWDRTWYAQHGTACPFEDDLPPSVAAALDVCLGLTDFGETALDRIHARAAVQTIRESLATAEAEAEKAWAQADRYKRDAEALRAQLDARRDHIEFVVDEGTVRSLEREIARLTNCGTEMDGCRVCVRCLTTALRHVEADREASVMRAYHVTLDNLGAPADPWPCNRVATLVRDLRARVAALEGALKEEHLAHYQYREQEVDHARYRLRCAICVLLAARPEGT